MSKNSLHFVGSHHSEKQTVYGACRSSFTSEQWFRSCLPFFSSILQEIILISLMCKSFLDQNKFAPKRVITCLSVMDFGLYLRLPLSNLCNWKPFFLSKPITFMKSFSGQLLASPSHSNTAAFNAGSSRTATSCGKCLSSNAYVVILETRWLLFGD